MIDGVFSPPPSKGDLPEEIFNQLESIKEDYLKGLCMGFSYSNITYEINWGEADKTPLKTNWQCLSNLKKTFIAKYNPKEPVYYKLYPAFNDSQLYSSWVELLVNSQVIEGPAQDILKKGLVLDLSKGISVFNFYLKNSLLRYVIECPRLVQSVINLHKAGADFWAAFFFCHSIYQVNIAHGVNVHKIYGIYPGTVDLLISLPKHCQGMGDKRSMLEELKSKKNNDYIEWNFQKNLLANGLDNKLIINPVWRILDPRLLAVRQAKNKQELEQILSQFKEELKR